MIPSALPTNNETEEPRCPLLQCTGYKEILSNYENQQCNDEFFKAMNAALLENDMFGIGSVYS